MEQDVTFIQAHWSISINEPRGLSFQIHLTVSLQLRITLYHENYEATFHLEDEEDTAHQERVKSFIRTEDWIIHLNVETAEIKSY